MTSTRGRICATCAVWREEGDTLFFPPSGGRGSGPRDYHSELFLAYRGGNPFTRLHATR
jgi:hypothetical protein